jgi:hypothetical protein
LKYEMRPEIWAACVGAIVIVVGIITWLLSIFPLQLTAGAGLTMIVIWVCYMPIVRFRYESFLRRSI